MKLTRGFTIILIVVCSAVVSISAESLLLNSFETPEEFAQWSLSDSKNSKLIQVNEHVTNGHYAGRFEVPKYVDGMEEWPAIVLKKEKGMPSDWSKFDTLCIDYDLPGFKDPFLRMRIDDQNKRLTRHLAIEPGAGTIRFNLNELDLSEIKSLHLYFTRPSESVIIYFDNIRLENSANIRLKKVEERWAFICENQSEILKQESKNFDLWKKIGGLIKSTIPINDRIKVIEQQIGILEHNLAVVKILNDTKEKHPQLPFGVAWADSMEKVFPREREVNANVVGNYQLELAKKEYESCQLVIVPATDKGLKKVRLYPREFVSEHGGRIQANFITIHPVGFVKTEKPPFEVEYVGWYPDPILTFISTVDILPGDVQPFWITVKTDENTLPGLYNGYVGIEAEFGGKLESYFVPMQIRVWDFELPTATNLRTAVAIYTSNLLPEKDKNKVNDFILRYRINPDDIYRTKPPAIEDLLRWKSQGMNAFNILYIRNEKDADGNFPIGKKREILNTLDQYIPLLKQNRLYELAYVYGFDEIDPDSYQTLKDIFSEIKKRYPDLKLLTTARDNTYGEQSGLEVVDAWCPLTNFLDLDAAERARERGKKVWWYICCYPHPPYANFFVESPAIEPRLLMGFHAQHFNVDGFLYYSLTRWYSNTQPIISGPYTNWNPASYQTYNGDGSLLCAGPYGPLTTIRFENIRDGLDDYDYIWILSDYVQKAEIVGGQEELVEEAKRTLQFDETFIKGLHSFSRDPLQLRINRRKIANLIERFQALDLSRVKE